MADLSDPETLGVGHIEPDVSSDDSVVEDVCGSTTADHRNDGTAWRCGGQANLAVTCNRTENQYSPTRILQSDLQVPHVPISGSVSLTKSGVQDMSIYSSTASLRSSILRNMEENGRKYHGYKEGKYVLPVDEVRFQSPLPRNIGMHQNR